MIARDMKDDPRCGIGLGLSWHMSPRKIELWRMSQGNDCQGNGNAALFPSDFSDPHFSDSPSGRDKACSCGHYGTDGSFCTFHGGQNLSNTKGLQTWGERRVEGHFVKYVLMT
jgi:hypothetical protein